MFNYFYEQLTSVIGGTEGGGVDEGSADGNGRNDDAPPFVIPNSYVLTDAQTAELAEAGLQQGVPFEIGSTGPQRHALHTKYIQLTEAVMSIQRESLKVRTNEIGDVNISFNYDATTDGMCSIYL